MFIPIEKETYEKVIEHLELHSDAPCGDLLESLRRVKRLSESMKAVDGDRPECSRVVYNNGFFVVEKDLTVRDKFEIVELARKEYSKWNPDCRHSIPLGNAILTAVEATIAKLTGKSDE